MKFNIHTWALACLTLFIFSCNNDESVDPNSKGSFTLHFDNIVGDQDLALGTTNYSNSSNESFTVTTLKYFISNIKLITTDNREYVIPQNESYFLLDESDPESLEVHLTNVPADDYKKVTFTIGVDSTKSVSDENQRSGVLDVSNSDMYWSYNEGYIFLKLDGQSPAAPESDFAYHIGGYGGSTQETKTFNNLKAVTLAFGADKATVRNNISPEVHLYVDVKKIFDGVNVISIADSPSIIFTQDSKKIADNYASMISFGHVHNDPVEN